MRARLERLDWMSPATKVEALKKLDTYQIKVGYPDHTRG
jgi:putative endopeptidase